MSRYGALLFTRYCSAAIAKKNKLSTLAFLFQNPVIAHVVVWLCVCEEPLPDHRIGQGLADLFNNVKE